MSKEEKIKVGQWARVNQEIIGKVIQVETEYPKAVKIKNKEGEFWLINYYHVKTADNLEDLVEVGDIVHFKTLDGTGELIIKTEDILNYLKFCVFDKQMIVTAIELHENRVAYRF